MAQQQTAPAENKMGTLPVNKLLVTMALPVIISMLVQALYNVVDSVFVARVSENALTAVSLAYPIQNLMIAVGSGTAVGVGAILSRSLGEKNQARANLAAINGLFLAFLSFLLFVIIGIFGAHAYFAGQTDIAEIVDGGTAYLRICCIISLGLFGQVMCERLLQATGRTVLSMISQGTGAIINIIFDPILIFGFFGAPKMGVAGAAAATVLGQSVSCVIGIILNIKFNPEIQLQFEEFRPNLRMIGDIYIIGVPSICMMSIGSVMTFGMNQILLAFSSTAAAVFGVYFKLQSFVFMPVIGLNSGIVPIISYNYGAHNRKRMMQTLRLGIFYAICIMVIGLILAQTIPDKLLLMFDASEDMLSIGVPALRTISIHFPIAAYSIVVGALFQALGKAGYSLVISVARQLVVLLPVAYLLSLTGTISNVWLAYPIAEIVSGILSTVFLMHVYRTVVLKLDEVKG